MEGFLIIFLLFSHVALVVSDEPDNSHQTDNPFPRPLILQYTDKNHAAVEDYELQLRCSSWRLAVETNNLGPWKTVPAECIDYVKGYVIGRAYAFDLERVAAEASSFARSVQLGGDGKDVWVFDVDETLLSTLPYYAYHGYGARFVDQRSLIPWSLKWVDKAVAPAIESSLRLYEEVLSLGFKVFLLTGRGEQQREVTVQNLMNVGFQNWDKLILRELDDHGKLVTTYKSERRDTMVKEGYRILGNSGDQWSDLLGSSVSTRSFKLPNPMYYIP